MPKGFRIATRDYTTCPECGSRVSWRLALAHVRSCDGLINAALAEMPDVTAGSYRGTFDYIETECGETIKRYTFQRHLHACDLCAEYVAGLFPMETDNDRT